ncbi:VanW family protein [Thermodesulfitimonas sp.]
MRRKSLQVAAVGLFGAFLAVLLGLWVVERVYVSPNVIVSGVKVGGMAFDGLTAAEALARLRDYEARLLRRPVRLECAGRAWALPLARAGISVEHARIIGEALSVGHRGWLLHRYLERYRVAQEGKKIPIRVRVDRQKLTALIAELTQEITILPQNAGFRVLPDDRIIVIPSREGRCVDATGAYDQLVAILNDPAREPVIRVPLRTLTPEDTTAEVLAMGLNCLLGEYATTFAPEKVNRVYNISVAAGALDGLVVRPGEVVSFNKVVGPRSSEAGYKTAPMIISNEFVDALGGGVCQVSTTLYNAVLRAGLAVVERHNHSLPVGYVPAGLDATVTYGGADFKFRNNTDKYLYLRTVIQGNRLVVKIFGNNRFKRRVEVWSWITEVIEPKRIEQSDPNLEAGRRVVKQKGIRGCRAQAERLIYTGEKVVREELPPSFYHPLDEIVAGGTKVVPTLIAPREGVTKPKLEPEPRPGTTVEETYPQGAGLPGGEIPSGVESFGETVYESGR